MEAAANVLLSAPGFHGLSLKLGFPASLNLPNSSVGSPHPLKPSSLRMRTPCSRLRPFPANLRAASTSDSVSTIETGEDDGVGSVSPVYVPTPPNRDLRTPHSGYHVSIYACIRIRIYVCIYLLFFFFPSFCCYLFYSSKLPKKN